VEDLREPDDIPGEDGGCIRRPMSLSTCVRGIEICGQSAACKL